VFKIDENLPMEVVAILRDQAFDAVTVRDEGLLGCDDARLSEACSREGRAIVTRDLGFIGLLRAATRPHGGLIVFRPRLGGRTALIRLAGTLAAKLPREPISDQVWILTDDRIRIRDDPAP
jgi:hypothetical protein